MKLAVSDIAWAQEEDAAAHELLVELGVSHLEMAPTRHIKGFEQVTSAEKQNLFASPRAHGLQVVGFQALLFGQPDLVLFESESARESCYAYLCKVCDLAAEAGGYSLVFGSPKNRQRNGLSRQQANTIAVPFFRRLGDYANGKGVAICLEPNPEAYQCDFITTTVEAVQLVREVASPGVRLQIDGGELAMNQEDLAEALSDASDLIGHVHISEPMLGGFAQAQGAHSIYAEVLRQTGYTGCVSIEMRRQPEGLEAVRRAVEFAQDTYLSPWHSNA